MHAFNCGFMSRDTKKPQIQRFPSKNKRNELKFSDFYSIFVLSNPENLGVRFPSRSKSHFRAQKCISTPYEYVTSQVLGTCNARTTSLIFMKLLQYLLYRLRKVLKFTESRYLTKKLRYTRFFNGTVDKYQVRSDVMSD